MNSSFAYSASIYAIIFNISFFCWIGFEAWVFSRDFSGKKSKSLDRGSALWVIGSLLCGLVLGFKMPEAAPQFNVQNHFSIFFFFGIALVYGGILFRFWAIQTLGKFFRTKIIIQEEHKLITSGPYKYLRNPSYTGAVITLLGFGLGIGNLLSAVVLFVAGIIAYVLRITVEERVLRERFGKAHDEYRKQTWALIPFIW